MKKYRIAFHTLGCKLNFSETSNLSRELQQDYQLVDFSEPADYYVIQSCVVTATAEKKCRSMIRQAHRRNPESSIFVVGCMSQLRASQLAAMKEVSLVLGNVEKFHLKELIKNGALQIKDKVNVSNILNNKEFYPAISGSDRTRTFVKIQDGCDYYCSFCTIPLARGRSRSNRVSATLDLISKALGEEPREVVLTGVNIGDFGKPHNETFLQLLEAIEGLDTSVRFRLSSIEPDLLADHIIDLVANSGKFMPHFHLPLQSGSDAVLKRMNRKYTAAIFESRVRLIKSKVLHGCIAADVIAGFPGETDNEFQQTYTFIERLPFSYLHVFPYSERPGTRSQIMTDKLNPDIIKNRVAELLKLAETKKQTFLTANIGRIDTVLFESENAGDYISGFTSNYIRVKTPFRSDFVNTIKQTRLETIDKDGVFIFQSVNT